MYCIINHVRTAKLKVKAGDWQYLNGKMYCPMCFKFSVVTEEVSWFRFGANLCVFILYLLLVSSVPFTVSGILISYTKIVFLLLILIFLISIIDKKYFAKPHLLDDGSLTAHYPKTALKLLKESSLDELREKYDLFTVNNPNLPPILNVDLICPNCQSTSILKLVELIKNQDAFECLDCGCVSKVNNTIEMEDLESELNARMLNYALPITLLMFCTIFFLTGRVAEDVQWLCVMVAIFSVLWMLKIAHSNHHYKQAHFKRGVLVAFNKS